MINRIKFQLSDYWQYLKLFSANARLFLIGSFFLGLSFSVYQLLLNLYFKEMGFSESLIGQVLSAMALGMALISIPAAVVIQKIRIKKILIGSTLLAGFFYFLQAAATDKQLLLLASFMVGVTISFYRVAAAPFFMRNSTSRERTYLFSINFGVMLLAGIVGSLSGGYLPSLWSKVATSSVLSFRYSLFTGILLGVLGIIPFFLIKRIESGQQGDLGKFNWNREIFKQRGGTLLKLFLPFFILGLGAGLIIPFLNLYFRNRFHLPAGTIGIYFSLLQFFMLAGILIGPVLSKKFGMVKTIVSTQLASIPFMLILAFTFNNTLAVMAFLLRGTLMNMSYPISTNFAMEKVKEDEQPLTNSLMMLAWTSSWVISANLGGKLINHYGFTPPLFISIVLYVISSSLYFKFFSNTKDIKIGKITTVFQQA